MLQTLPQVQASSEEQCLGWLVEKTEMMLPLCPAPHSPRSGSCCPGSSSAPTRSPLHCCSVSSTALTLQNQRLNSGQKIQFFLLGAWGYSLWLNTCPAKNTGVSKPEKGCCIPPLTVTHGICQFWAPQLWKKVCSILSQGIRILQLPSEP